LEKIEFTVYGPNKDGKGGGAERIIQLGDTVSSIWKTIATIMTLLTPIVGFLAYLIIEHIKGGG
jgi:hypothetical protein